MVRSIYGDFLLATADWFKVSRGREIFRFAASLISEFSIADSGFFVYQKILGSHGRQLVPSAVYQPWGDFQHCDDHTYSLLMEQIDELLQLPQGWVSLSKNPFLQAILPGVELSHIGIWPIKSQDIQNGIVIVTRRQDVPYSITLESSETLMNICNFQISNAINALLTTRIIENKNSEIEHQIQVHEKAEIELKYEANLRLNLMDNVAVGIFIATMDRTIFRANRRLEDLLGYSREELAGASFRIVHTSEDSFQTFAQYYQRLFESGNEIVNIEYPFRKKDGTVFMAACSGTLLDPQNPSIGVIWSIQDISDRLAMETQLKHLAQHDALTGLPNRSVLESHIMAAMERAHRQNQFFAVGMLDLDNFKPVNDTYGHPAGDQLLKIIANRLRDALRKNDTLVRLGGDEFVLVIENVQSKDNLIPAMYRFQEAIEAPIRLQLQQDEVEVHVGASMGLVLYPEIVGEPDSLIREADQALYQVKAMKGRRKRWWVLSTEVEYFAGETEDILPYGKPAEQILATAQSLLQKIQNDWMTMFDEVLIQPSKSKYILQEMEYTQYWEWAQNHALHLEQLVDPEQNELDHHNLAEKLGKSLACFGIEWLHVFDLHNRRMVYLEELANHHRTSSEIVHILMKRLWKDTESQAVGYHTIDMQHLHIMTDIDTIVWENHQWGKLANNIVNHLVKLDEITSVAIAQPNQKGQFLYEYIAGDGVREYVQALAMEQVPPVSTHSHKQEGLGPTGRAWRYGSIQRSHNCTTDESMRAWRDFLIEHEIFSMVAIPLLAPSGRPYAVLSVYSQYPGGLNSPTQQSMIEHLQKIIGIRLESILTNENVAETTSIRKMSNNNWENRIIMYYQPIVSLQTGELSKVEALARLQDDDGQLQMPAEFLPLLTTNGLLKLFELGLEHGSQAILEWEKKGIINKLSINIPSPDLVDIRYPEALETVLQRHNLASNLFTLEILNADRAIGTGQTHSMLEKFDQMGVQLAEGDAGLGYCSLTRQERLPIRIIKISHSLIKELGRDPIRMFTIIYNLTNTAQTLGMQVVVEGLETWSHVEMAYFLGANYGQGYGIAKPMEKDQLEQWAKSFKMQMHSHAAKTALGTLAGYWRWIMEWDYLLSHHHSLMQPFNLEACVLGNYIQNNHLKGTRLDVLHHRIHESIRLGRIPKGNGVHNEILLIMLGKVEKELNTAYHE